MIHFSIRDLFWLILLAAIISSAYRRHRAMESDVAKMRAETEAARILDAEKVAEKLAELRRKQAVLDKDQQAAIRVVELNELRDQKHADEVSVLKKRLERYEAPAYPPDAEPGVYFLGPARYLGPKP